MQIPYITSPIGGLWCAATAGSTSHRRKFGGLHDIFEARIAPQGWRPAANPGGELSAPTLVSQPVTACSGGSE